LAFVVASQGSHAGETERKTQEGDADSRSLLLGAPFAVPRANYFHTALEVPPFEPARTLERDSVFLRLRTAHVHSAEKRTIDGYRNNFDGLYHEWAALECDWGVIDRLEIGTHIVYAGWDECIDHFELLDQTGNPIVLDEDRVIYGTGASKRHDNVSVVGLKAKALLLTAERSGLDLSFAPSVKFPVSRAGDLTSAGTYDLAFTLLASIPMRRVVLHANLGATVPLGDQNLFVPEAGIKLNPFVHGAIGATFTLPSEFAVGIQLEANSSAFRDVELLDDPPFTIVAGVRKLFGKLVVEVGGGTGLDWSSGYRYSSFFSVGYVF